MTTTFDRYEILDTIGSGGMATVYRAHDPRFDREVAIKIMSADYAHNQTFVQRFLREAKTVAGLEHTAIVPVYDYGRHDGRPFLVMRYMSGGSLADRIKQGPLPLREAARILNRIAEALDWAHSQAVIHRDVKPANILFDQQNYPCLADFGIVKLTESTTQLTGSGMVGTPAYMAPEMMDKGGLTYLVDVYALSVTLFQMLAGRHPFEADTPMGVLMAHVNKPAPDIRQLRPDLPDTVQAVIECGMAKTQWPVSRVPVRWRRPSMTQSPSHKALCRLHHRSPWSLNLNPFRLCPHPRLSHPTHLRWTLARILPHLRLLRPYRLSQRQYPIRRGDHPSPGSGLAALVQC
jgi:serine/threonine protein kinase